MARITYRKTRRGETIDIRADKGEDLRNVVKEMAKPVSAAPALTADTITDEQIRELRDRVLYPKYWAGDHSTWDAINLCRIALSPDALPIVRAEARARCAEILEARANGGVR